MARYPRPTWRLRPRQKYSCYVLWRSAHCGSPLKCPAQSRGYPGWCPVCSHDLPRHGDSSDGGGAGVGGGVGGGEGADCGTLVGQICNMRLRMRKLLSPSSLCKYVLFKCHRMWEYTWWLYKNVQQLIFTWDDCGDWDSTPVQKLIPTWLADWLKTWQKLFSQDDRRRDVQADLYHRNEPTPFLWISEKRNTAWDIVISLWEFMRALEGNKAKVNHYCWLLAPPWLRLRSHSTPSRLQTAGTHCWTPWLRRHKYGTWRISLKIRGLTTSPQS